MCKETGDEYFDNEYFSPCWLFMELSGNIPVANTSMEKNTSELPYFFSCSHYGYLVILITVEDKP